MTKSLTLIVLLCVVISVFPFDAHALFKSTKVTLVVVDEEGSPLEGVDAGVAFERNTGWGTDVTPQDKFTDVEGRVTFSGQSNGHIGYGAEKEGYYPSYYDYDFKDPGLFGWKPWNPELKLVMRKIGNPVSMYARNVHMSSKKIVVPVLGEEVGFDLEAYDWVAPYGNGKTVDFIFKAEKNVKNKRTYDATLALTFNNSMDGVVVVQEDFSQGSEFKLPRFAPESGYENHKLFKESRHPNRAVSKNFNEDDSYIFRVRSKYVDGKLVEAKYGKIHGPFFIDPIWTDTLRVYFTYYFNPDGTRNLEFDPNRNLFGNLPPLERVGIK